MGSCAETEHLLPDSPSQQETDYNTIGSQANNGADFNAISTDEGQPEQENRSSGPTLEETPNDLENQGRCQQRLRLHLRLTSFLSSYRPLKYSAIAFGLWSEHGCACYLVVRIPIAVLFVLSLYEGFTNHFNSFQSCSFERWAFGAGGVTVDHTTTFDYWMILTAAVPSYLMMVYCIRHLSKRPHVLQLPQAFNLAKKTKSVNMILLVSISMIVTSIITRQCFPFLILSECREKYDITGPAKFDDDKQGLYYAWQLFISVVAWQAVISCLVFGVVMKGLSALVDQCLDRIITIEADSVDHYIQVHREICCNVESTFRAFKNWFNFNTFLYLVLIFWVFFIRVFSFPFNDIYVARYESCFILIPEGSVTPLQWNRFGGTYYFLTLFLYAMFICYYPWYSMASLKRSLNHLVQKLNDKTDWSEKHPFKNRLHLNSFLQYAKHTEYRPFMQFTCTAKIPHFSIVLAVCGLLLALYNSWRKSIDRHKYIPRPTPLRPFPIYQSA